ncbi:MAG: hypothetical protein V3U75_13250 [Methylococcaceae bacterium]
MTSNKPDQEAFVWIWLPNETRPVIAGKLEVDNGNILFNYGKSYLGGCPRIEAVARENGFESIFSIK